MRTFKYSCDPSMQPFIEQVLQGEYDHHKNNEHSFKHRLDLAHILDIGANIGSFSFWAAQTYPNAKIEAYEPSPKCIAAYKKHMEDSAIPAFIYTIHNYAITSDPALSVTLYEGAYNCGMNSLDKKLAGQSVETFEAPTLHPAKLPQTNYLKVDTEGCEIDIFTHYLATHEAPSLISYEWHSVEDRTALEDLLRKDYLLCSGSIFAVNLGVNNMLHRRHVG